MKFNPILVITLLLICSICHSIPNIKQILDVAIPVVMYGGFILVVILHMVRHLDLPPNETPYPNYNLAFEDFPAASKPYATYARALRCCVSEATLKESAQIAPHLAAISSRSSLRLYPS